MSCYKELKFSPELNSTILDEKLGSTTYTTKEAIRLFSQNCEEFVEKLGNGEIHKVNVDEIGEGKGFCSRVFRISIEFSGQKCTFVVKAPTYEQFLVMCEEELDINQSRSIVVELHNCECNAYELLKKLNNIPTPRVYYVEKADDKSLGLLIFEDVGQIGKSLDVHESATLEQCKELIRIIVTFQTQVKFIKDQSWRHNFLKNYQAFDFSDNAIKQVIRPALECEDKELADGVRKYYDLDLKKLAKLAIEEFSDCRDDSILCHTDMWSNNLFIKLNPDGTFSNNIHSIIDWQMSIIGMFSLKCLKFTHFLGNPLYDLCCFILLCCDEKIRRESEYDLVNFYYDELFESYSKHNGAKPTFTREKAHEYYKLAFAQLIVSLITTFSIHAIPNINSQVAEDQEKANILIRRVKAALKDTQVIWNTYDLAERCKLTE